MFVDLLDQFNVNQATDQNSASLINLYMEEEQTTRLQQYPFAAYKDPPKGVYKTAIYQVPGLTVFCNTGQANVRAMLEQDDLTYAIAGNQFGVVSSLGVWTHLGTLTTSLGYCKIQAITGGIDTNNQLLMIDGANGYTFNIGSQTFAQIVPVTDGILTINVTAGGSGYTSTPAVVITDSTGTGCTATAIVQSNIITAVTVTNPGANYTSPSISFTGGGGSSAAATVTLYTNAFPSTATDVSTLDDYVFVLDYNSITYNMSNLSDTTSWDALNFASKTRKPDKIKALMTLNGELWTMGTKTCEIWDDVGNADFPLQRRPDLFVEEGVAARHSVVLVGLTGMYLAKSRTGGYGITQISGYVPQVISTKPVMYFINQFSTVDDAYAYGYALNGHEFYEITFPTGNMTFSFDVSNESWFTKQSYISGAYGAFRGSCSAFCYGKSLIGDMYSGNIYYQDENNNTENGVPLLRQVVTPHIYQGGKNITVNYLQVDCQSNVGLGATFLLERSTDHAQTWQTVGTYTIPTQGNQTIRIPTIGTANVFTFRITVTGNFKFTLLGFQADISVGMW